MRNTNSLLGKKLRDQINLDALAPQSEKLSSYRKFYVDKGVLETLYTNDNQLIVGRRGTGKTHLLGSFREGIDNSKGDHFCVPISMAQMRSVALDGGEAGAPLDADGHRTSAALFVSFLQALEKELTNGLYDRMKTIKGSPAWSKADALLTHLFTEVHPAEM